MIRDRGRMKWTSMMLPEHVKLLRDWAKEDLWEQQTEIDEQLLEEFNEVAVEAMQANKNVVLRYYEKYEHHYEMMTGKIYDFDLLQNELKMINEDGAVYTVPVLKIVDIEIGE